MTDILTIPVDAVHASPWADCPIEFVWLAVDGVVSLHVSSMFTPDGLIDVPAHLWGEA